MAVVPERSEWSETSFEPEVLRADGLNGVKDYQNQNRPTPRFARCLEDPERSEGLPKYRKSPPERVGLIRCVTPLRKARAESYKNQNRPTPRFARCPTKIKIAQKGD